MRKSIKIILPIFLFLLIFFIAALPSWISTSSGTQTVVNWINSHSKNQISVERVSLSWLGGQHIENLKYENKKGTTFFEFLSFDTETSLLSLIFTQNLKKTVLDTPHLKMVASAEEEKIKEDKEESDKTSRRWVRFCPSFKDTVVVTKGSVDLSSDKPLTISDIEIHKNGDAKNLSVTATTTSDEKTQGFLSINATLSKNIQAKMTAQDFPMAILDVLTRSKLYTTGLGPTLNLDLNLLKDGDESLNINGSAKSANLNAFIDGSTQNNHFSLNPKTRVDFAITPAFFKQIIDQKKRGDWDLASKTNVTLQVENGSLDLKKGFKLKNLDLHAKATINRAELHHATLGSYSLKQFDAHVDTKENLEIVYHGEIQGKETTKLAGTISVSPAHEVTFEYDCIGFPVTLLELISEQLSQKVKLLLGNQFDLTGKGKVISKQINTKFTLNSPQTKVNGKVKGTLPDLNFELSGNRKVFGDKAKMLGDSVNFYLNGVGKIAEDQLIVPLIKGILFNPYFSCDLSGQIGEENKPFNLNQIKFAVLGTIKKTPIEDPLVNATLKDSTLYIEVDGSKNIITSQAKGKGFEANATIKNFIAHETINLKQADTYFSGNFVDFPVAAISPLISDTLDLKALVGKTLSLNAKGSYTPQQEPCFSVDLNAHGAGFSSALSFTLDSLRKVKQNKPSYIYWDVSPERFQALLQSLHKDPHYQPHFVLLHPTKLELNITQFSCPTDQTQGVGHFLSQSGFVGDIKIAGTSFANMVTQESISFQEVTGVIKGENFSRAIDVALKGNILAPNLRASEKSSFDFKGQMFNFWTREGKLNREALSVKGELNANLLPVQQITGLVVLDHETRSILQAVLGEFVNAHVSGEISQQSGPVTIDLKSSNFKALLPLQFQKNAIFLRDYVDAEISLTEAVSATLLKDLNPLFTGAFSDHPLKVYIDPQNFMIPIRPYSLEHVHIGKAIFDIGKIRVRNGGQIQSLMQFLNAREISPDGTMEAWFTPIFMTLQNGVASYKRFDALLAGNVHIALWGSVNLINDNVRMTLAIAPTTLYQRFKISGLRKTDMFQVQMYGTTKRLELDWSSAYSRIAWIVARGSVGPISDILGGILEQLVGSKKVEIAPPPTTDPLPWESFYSSEPGQTIPQEAPFRGTRKWLRSLLPS